MFGEVGPIVDSAVHLDEMFHSWFVLDTRVVDTRVHHDDGEREDVAAIYKWDTIETRELKKCFQVTFHAGTPVAVQLRLSAVRHNSKTSTG